MPLVTYPNVLEASRGLLIDVCSRLSSLRTNYVIAGGWVPYLRCIHPTLRHPGTKDVDVLLNDQRTSAEDGVAALLSAGYLPSAKHPFQLLRPLKVRESDGEHDLIFNVDLMHPSEAAKDSEMFSDIMELDIFENYDPAKKLGIKSIIFPSSAIVFEQGLWNDFPLRAIYPLGGESDLNIPLMDEIGLVLSKCESATRKKRERDSFDIYFTLTATNGDQISRRIREFGARFPQVQKQLNILREFIERDHGAIFNLNTSQYVPPSYPTTNFAAAIKALLFD
jgi:hypothetical protein